MDSGLQAGLVEQGPVQGAVGKADTAHCKDPYLRRRELQAYGSISALGETAQAYARKAFRGKGGGARCEKGGVRGAQGSEESCATV